MGIGHGIGPWGLVLIQGAVGWLAHHNYSRLPPLPNAPDREVGHVSIVVPARNEAHRLRPLLRSLRALRYMDVDVLVVDDASCDGTAQVASEEGARVLRISGPEPGWAGKSFACWQGAQSTAGEWILFTDADTVHGPDSLGKALALATETGAGLCSLLARQRCESVWEKLVLPYAYFLYFVGARNINARGGVPVANGQYMLFRRTAYQCLGGHAAVRGSIIEDVDLARRAQELALDVVLAHGEADLSVRMYTGSGDLWTGMGKNAFRFVRASPRAGFLTAAASVAFGTALPAAARSRSRVLRCALLLAPAASLARWNARFGVSPVAALLFPVAACAFLLLALDSMRRALTPRGTVWKGRRY